MLRKTLLSILTVLTAFIGILFGFCTGIFAILVGISVIIAGNASQGSGILGLGLILLVVGYGFTKLAESIKSYAERF